MKTRNVLKLNLHQQDRWLMQHLPNRVGAAWLRLPGLSAEWEWKRRDPLPPGAEDREFDKGADGNHKWCIGRAAEHGQKAAMRWLIEFVGVARGKKTKEPCRPAEFDPDTDVSIQSFVSDGSDLEIPIDKSNRRSKSWVLADVWKGCSQSCVHATDHTNHPSADPPELSEAFMIVVEHLQAALYTRRMEVRLSEIVQKMH